MRINFLVISVVLLSVCAAEIKLIYLDAGEEFFHLKKIEHIKNYEWQIEQINLHISDEIEKKEKVDTLKAWILRIKKLDTNQYMLHSFINNSIYYLLLSGYGFITSFIFSFFSLSITKVILSNRNINISIILSFLDIIIAFCFASGSFVMISILYSGIFINSNTSYHLLTLLYSIFDLKFEDLRGIFPTPFDYISNYSRILDEKPISFIIYLWGEFAQSMYSVISGNFAIGLRQTIWNWIIALSFLPTLLHLILTFTFVILKNTEPYFRPVLERFFVWMHNHPRGPIMAVSIVVGGIAVILQSILQ